MSGRIRINFVSYYPVVNTNCSRFPHFHVTKGCSRPGIFVEIITLLAGYLNLTIEVNQQSGFDEDWGVEFDQVERNETDTYAGLLINTTLRAEKFEFTDGLYEIYTKIVVKKTHRSLASILSFLNVYSWDVYFGMFFAFLFFSLFGLIVRYVELRLKLRKKVLCGEIWWKMLRFQLVQSERIDYRLIAGQTSLLVFSLFQICVILGLFQGLILTSIVRKTHVAPFTANDDFAQMIKDKKLYVVASSSVDWFYQEIETSYESPFYELRDAFKHNNYQILESDDKVLDEIDKGKGAVALTLEDYVLTFRSETYCNLVYIESSIPPRYVRLMFRKGSPFVPLFNEAIKANHYKIERIKLKYLDHKPPSKCAVESGGPAPLTIAPYFGLLSLFFLCILLACFVFGWELLNSGGTTRNAGNILPIAKNNENYLNSNTKSTHIQRKKALLSVLKDDSSILADLNDEVANLMIKIGDLPPGTKLLAFLPQHK